ncbi:AraC family transcriptional regulator [Prolixibacteraceae bacterium Z1-6]|uniref:AraC family transcriptional regulator n=1 Tax=Draconibacterium aestuarii TaxID=2998507 RepID=A0A9X3FAQ5_9BACT|nr:AraC family transcriptional regulator [Prolixibacteraceae bacterium Z1-6]
MQKESKIEYTIDGFIGQRMTYFPGIIKKKILKDPRISDLYITHIGIFPKALGHLRKRPFGCSQYILIYCVDGEGWVEIEGRRKIISGNQLFVIPSKTPCSYGANNKNPWTNYWLHFTGKNASLYSPVTNQLIDIPPTKDARIEERLMLFEEMMQNAEDFFNVEKVVYANICLKQFLTSVKHLNVYRAVKKGSENDLLKKVISFMKNNLHKNIRISDLAETCNCSSSNIYKLFRQNLNSAPQDFFIHLKIERARKYLSQTNLKVKEIGAKLGYDDPYYFSRIFTKHVGLSPANYRKEER